MKSLVVKNTIDVHRGAVYNGGLLYVDQNRPGKERTGSPLDSHDKEIQPLTFTDLLEPQASERACTQTTLTMGLPKYMFTFDTEGGLARFGQ